MAREVKPSAEGRAQAVGAVFCITEVLHITLSCDDIKEMIGWNPALFILGLSIKLILFLLCMILIISLLLYIAHDFIKKYNNVKATVVVVVIFIPILLDGLFFNIALCSPHYKYITDNRISRSYENLSSEFSELCNIVKDLSSNDISVIETSNAVIYDEEIFGVSGDWPVRYCFLECDDIIFPIGKRDYNDLTSNYSFKNLSVFNHSRYAKFQTDTYEKIKVTYYSSSMLIISIEIVDTNN